MPDDQTDQAPTATTPLLRSPSREIRETRPGRTVSIGVMSVSGIVLDFKHGLPGITEPFSHCRTAADIFVAIMGMSDTMVFGIVAWLFILGASIWGAATTLIDLTRRWRR